MYKLMTNSVTAHLFLLFFHFAKALTKQSDNKKLNGIFSLNTDCSQKATLSFKSFTRSTVFVLELFCSFCDCCHIERHALVTHRRLSHWQHKHSCHRLNFYTIQSVPGWRPHISQRPLWDSTTVLLLCVSQWWSVMYGDLSGVTHGAELL